MSGWPEILPQRGRWQPEGLTEGASLTYPSERTRNFARRLRRKMTLPEVLIWQQLRLRPFGIKFRRQHPVGPYIADFYCEHARLIVEIDGMSHDMGDRPAKDLERDAYLAPRGFYVIRIPARDVLSDLQTAVDIAVGAVMCRRTSTGVPPDAPSTASRSPSPSGGGFMEGNP